VKASILIEARPRKKELQLKKPLEGAKFPAVQEMSLGQFLRRPNMQMAQ